MKGNQKVAKKKGVPNERRRLSLRPRPSPIAKTPVVAEGSKKSKKSKKSTQEREPSYVSLSVTNESERDGSESERSKKSTPVREPSHQPRSMSDESEREGSDSEEEMQPPPPPPPRETPTPPPRETPTTPKKLKLPPVDLNKNPVEEEEFGGKEVRVTQPEILLRCKEKTETYGKPRPRSSGKKATPTAGPKNRGRPRMRAVDAAPPITGKRKSEPSQWVQTPFTAGKKGKKKTKTKA